jgi:hypothetical protein
MTLEPRVSYALFLALQVGALVLIGAASVVALLAIAAAIAAVLRQIWLLFIKAWQEGG